MDEDKSGNLISGLTFAEQVDKVLSGADVSSTHLEVLKTTPPILRMLGVPNLPILMTARHVKTTVQESGTDSANYHGLGVDVVKRLPELIADPVMVMDSLTKEDSIVIVTETTDKENRPVIGAIKLDGVGRDGKTIIRANILASAYGKDNFESFIRHNIEEGTVLYADKEKSQALSVNPGIQFPDVMASLDFNTIIRKTKAFVNTEAEKNIKTTEKNEAEMKTSENNIATQSPYERVQQVREEMIKTLLAHIEHNPTEWQSGWNSIAAGAPYNGKTNTAYRGLNALYLACIGAARGYKDTRWVTFNQAKDLGASVKRGEKSVPVIFYENYDRKTKKAFSSNTVKDMTDDEKAAYIKENVYAVLKYSSVFNAEQCHNFPERKETAMSNEERANQNVKIETIIARSAAPIFYDGGSRAFYSPGEDKIHLPIISAFNTMQDYYATALHEIAHSTGHESRLNRNLSGGFGSVDYAKEELRAELSSVFLQMETGIRLAGKHIENHAAYLNSWLIAAKEDPSVFFKAAADAQKIADYVTSNYLNAENISQSSDVNSREIPDPMTEYLRTNSEIQSEAATAEPPYLRKTKYGSPVSDIIETEGGHHIAIINNTERQEDASPDGYPAGYIVAHDYNPGTGEFLTAAYGFTSHEEARQYLNEEYGVSVQNVRTNENEHKEITLTGEEFSSLQRGFKILDNVKAYEKYSGSESEIMREYSHIKRQNPDKIIFRRAGDFYEVLGDDAVALSKELDLTLTGRDIGGERVNMVGIPYHAISNYARELIDKGYKVALYEDEFLRDMSVQNVRTNETDEGSHKEELNQSINEWYTKTYPDDLYGLRLVGTFSDLQEAINNGADIYGAALGIDDSVVRERVFGHLAQINNVPYEEIYNSWMSPQQGTRKDERQDIDNQTAETKNTKQKEWLNIDLPDDAVVGDYGNNVMVRMPKGEFSYYSFYVPSKFIKEADGKKLLTVSSDYTFRLHNDGKQVELTGKELSDSFKGDYIDKTYKRVAPSRKYAKVLENIEKNIPAELKEIPAWCCYRTRWNDDKGKKDKFIISPIDGKWASSTEPQRWVTFDAALKYARENNCEGLSVLLDKNYGITCIDLDKCITDAQTGTLKERAAKLVETLSDTYIERSTSGNGLHIFLKDDILKNGQYNMTSVDKDKGDLEVYDDKRIMSVTGDMYSKSNALTRAGSAATVYLRGELGERKSVAGKGLGTQRTPAGLSLSDTELIRWIQGSKQSGKFNDLYQGRGVSGNRSDDDAKLAHMLLYFNGGDKEQAFRIMRESALYRPDKPDAYYRTTIDKMDAKIDAYARRPTLSAGGVGKTAGDKKKKYNQA